jgi:hypothetical protein
MTQFLAPLYFSEGHNRKALAFANTRRTIRGCQVVEPEVNIGPGPQEQIGFTIHAVGAVIDGFCRAIIPRIEISANHTGFMPAAITIPFHRLISHFSLYFSEYSYSPFSLLLTSAKAMPILASLLKPTEFRCRARIHDQAKISFSSMTSEKWLRSIQV